MANDDRRSAQVPARQLRRVIAASLIGSVIEWYEYLIYGTMAALIFNRLFFPAFDPAVGTILAFATFAVGFASRPIGAAVYGHLGDKIGRKSALVSTLLLMGCATAIIGLLPTYGQIGVWAPVLLIALRFIQGIALGGEWGGATLLAMEYSPAHRQGLVTSLPQIGVPMGLLLSSGVIALTQGSLTNEQFMTWGWRIPFLLSVVLVVVGLVIRLKIDETPDFRAVATARRRVRYPIVEVVRSHPRALLTAMGARVANNAQFFLVTVFFVSYGTSELGLDNELVLTGTVVASVIGLAGIPLYGALSDRIGRRPILLGGAVAMAVMAFPLFGLLGSGSAFLITLAIVIGLNIGHDSQYATQASFICEKFPANVRYSGISLAYQVPSIFVGGLAPIVASSLVYVADGRSWGVSVYVILLCAITFVAVFFSPETAPARREIRNRVEERAQ